MALLRVRRCTQVCRFSKALRRTAQSYRCGGTVTYSSLFQTWMRSAALRFTTQVCRCGGARGHCDVQPRRNVVGVMALGGTAMCSNYCYRCDGVRRHCEQLIGRRTARRYKCDGVWRHYVQHDAVSVAVVDGTTRAGMRMVVYTRPCRCDGAR